MTAPLHEADNPADREPFVDDPRPDPQVTYLLDGLPFGEYDADGCWWIVRDTKGWHNAPGMKTARTERAHGAGSSRGASWRKERIVTLKGQCEAPSVGARQAAIDRFNGVCADGGTLHELKVTDQLGRVRTADVELEGELDVVVKNERRFEFQIQVAAPDPRKHGLWQDPISELGTDGVGGLDFITAGGLDFGGGGLNFGTPPTPGVAQVANYGNEAAFPFFRLKGPLSPATIADLTHGFELHYGMEIAAGEVVVINCDPFRSKDYRAHACYSSVRGRVRALVNVPAAWPVVDPYDTARFQLRATGGQGAELMTSLRSAWS